jgi:dCMP deaminase
VTERSRPALVEIFGQFARLVATRSTCNRLQVGSVITNGDFTRVLSIGYNGNARGLPNACDREEPGNCGCIHSEINALLKLDYAEHEKVMFVTDSPCANCAKAIINAGIQRLYFIRRYRKSTGLDLLAQAGISSEQISLPELTLQAEGTPGGPPVVSGEITSSPRKKPTMTTKKIG